MLRKIIELEGREVMSRPYALPDEAWVEGAEKEMKRIVGVRDEHRTFNPDWIGKHRTSNRSLLAVFGGPFRRMDLVVLK